MPVSAHDVARELRDRLPGAGVVKVHKLLYLCQGWHLAWYDAPIFVEPIEAWENGPVVADLWHDEKHRPNFTPDVSELAPDQMLTVDYVASTYGGLTGRELIDLTHGQQPWRNAWTNGLNGPITELSLRMFFTGSERVDPDDEMWDEEVLGQRIEKEAAGVDIGFADEVDETDDIRRWLAGVTR